MSRSVVPPPYRQGDPSPWQDRRSRRRIVIFIVVVLLGAALLRDGRDLQAVLLTLLGFGLAGAAIARWVIDDAPLPGIGSVLPPPADPGPVQ